MSDDARRLYVVRTAKGELRVTVDNTGCYITGSTGSTHVPLEQVRALAGALDDAARCIGDGAAYGRPRTPRRMMDALRDDPPPPTITT